MGGYVTLPPALVGTPEGDRWTAAALVHVACPAAESAQEVAEARIKSVEDSAVRSM